ncbi:hypothetical protein E2493_09195 [Sphingomonas parva]|uniref:Uncharacterized protein n=1 Tax=Sphingomonas parva TaxID=2555898 RepID=A0A4Y8ZRD9_9SPHN|nr:hypothetical protein [Sphingomonas parva]TFI58590.1 hypothetical protein E2493_09195 [Sphingomonas parva]
MSRRRRRARVWAPALVLAAAGAGLAALKAIPSRDERSGSWVEIAVATDGTAASVDEQSLASDPRGIALRQRFVRRGKPARIDQRVVYACSERAVYVLESEERDANGELLGRRRLDAPERNGVPPDSLADAIFDAVC